MDEVSLTIHGMTCKGCEVRIKQALEGLPGVRRVTVSYQTGEARVKGESGRLRAADVVAAVRRAGGYQPVLQAPGSAAHTLEQELGQRGERMSVWSSLAALGIGIAGSWC